MINWITIIPAKIAYTIVIPSGSTNICGPGLTPISVNAPSITEVTVSPGTPKQSIGIRAPPVVPLFEASGAAIPSGTPVPNLSPLLESFFATW